MNILEKISEVFSVFHDGTITAWSGDRTLLKLTVECQYLAERIDPTFKIFYLELIDINRIDLDPWYTDIPEPTLIFTTLEDIFQAELEIMQGDLKDESILVTCIQHDKKFNYSGANLYVACSDIRVYDQAKKELTLDKLSSASKEYWDDFRKNKPKR